MLTNRPLLAKDEVVKEERRWYARDKGETTIREVATAVDQNIQPVLKPTWLSFFEMP